MHICMEMQVYHMAQNDLFMWKSSAYERTLTSPRFYLALQYLKHSWNDPDDITEKANPLIKKKSSNFTWFKPINYYTGISKMLVHG